jgi:segregation and condensation protein B
MMSWEHGTVDRELPVEVSGNGASAAGASAAGASAAGAPVADAPGPGGEAGGAIAANVEPPLARGLEALLFLADEPLDVDTLAIVLEAEPEVVEDALKDLARRSIEEERGTEVRATAGGWRMYTAPAARPVIERWALAGRTGRLTQAALETLAVVAYKQPIGRQEIGEIRGVNADGAVRSLVARGFVAEVGRDPGPGQAALFGTTRLVLERLGLDSLEQLPPLTEFLPEAPAPDEPELGALKEIRRRLAAGGELTPGGLGGRSATQTNTGTEHDSGEDDDDHDVMPPPLAAAGGRGDHDGMDELSDRLEQAARNAVGRLRAAVAAGDGQPRDDEPHDDEPQDMGPHDGGPHDDGPGDAPTGGADPEGADLEVADQPHARADRRDETDG